MENSLPLVSVIMATYNRAAMLPRAIESVLNQTMANLELIIIDDGSTDDTGGVLAAYQKRDDRIVLFQQSNSGLSKARNLGIQRARGKYIAIMDDDDYCHPDRMKMQVEFLQAHKELQACACLWEYVDKETGHHRQQQLNYVDLFRPHDKAEEVPLPAFVLNTTAMITRAALIDLKGYRPFFPCAVDYDLTLRFQERFQAKLIRQYLYYRDSKEDYERVTKRDYCLVMQMHIIAHISAWYRRNKRFDPVEGDKTSEEIIPLLSGMPAASRRHLLVYITRCVERINTLSRNQKTKKNLRIIGKTFSYVRPGLILMRWYNAKRIVKIHYWLSCWYNAKRIVKIHYWLLCWQRYHLWGLTKRA